MQKKALWRPAILQGAVVLSLWASAFCPLPTTACQKESSKSSSSVNVLTDSQRQELASQFINRAINNWIETDAREPETGIRLIKQLIMCLDVESAERWLKNQSFAELGINLDSVGETSYQIRQFLIQAHMHLGNETRALELVGSSPKKATEVGRYLETKYILTKGYARRGQLQLAIETADSIPRKYELPNGQSTSGAYRRQLAMIAVMQAYCDTGQYGKAVDVANLYSATPFEARRLKVELLEEKVFREGPRAGFAFLTQNFARSSWADRSHEITQRLFRAKRIEEAVELHLLALPFDTKAETHMLSMLQSLLQREKIKLAFETADRLMHRLAQTEAKESRTILALELASRFANSGYLNHAMSLLVGISPNAEGYRENVSGFSQSFNRVIYSKVFSGKLSIGKAAALIERIQLTEVREDAFEQVLSASFRAGRINDARRIAEEYLVDSSNDPFLHASLFLGQVEFDDNLSNQDLRGTRNKLRYRRAYVLLSEGSVDDAIDFVSKIETIGTENDGMFEELTRLAIRLNQFDAACQIIAAKGKGNEKLLSGIARNLISNGRTEKTARLLNSARELLPDWEDIGFLIYAKSSIHSSSRLKEPLIAAKGIQSDFAQYDRFLAYLAVCEGKAENAIEHCRSALKKRDAPNAIQYSMLRAGLLVESALTSGESGQIKIACQLQSSKVKACLAQNAKDAKQEIGQLTAAIEKVDNTMFRALAFQQLGVGLTPELEILQPLIPTKPRPLEPIDEFEY